jgi:hypothetical protein
VPSQRRRILAAVPDRWTVLIVADDLSDCRRLVGVLSDRPAFKVVGPLPALEALRFCSTVITVDTCRRTSIAWKSLLMAREPT